MLANPAPGPAGRSTHPGRTNVGALAPAASALLGVALLTGCSSGITESVSTAVKDSSSAVATARIALRQDMAGKLTRAATSTTLDDGLKELQSSRSTVLKLSPATTVDRGTQRQALDALDQCAAGFATARAALAAGDGGTPSLADGDKALADAQDVLKQLESTVASP
ncbi:MULTISPECIES: hypothetical protein [Pseudarthrobacter]|uniref:Uncharacterized protein n=1 Tax=Pseudarthrobacter niigatensis TaxID=369935 RepID=A0AAJ1SYT1_9MICC|nr:MULTISPECIES: hypothetical protein [Pseudarthrobacter]MDQ0146823.1 hypothetical protein [Pseudarthrobacter niigatensis]MDQ0264631.1 hypothetical protein [Pseudarthrobacter niigatensis]QDG87551.1 hypothetical protein NIBR502770_02895 [Pseudarthrobacter sp. NIBRBAC000502770]